MLRGITAGVPELMADLDHDTRNVLLTLARIWMTLSTGVVGAKDEAARWEGARGCAEVVVAEIGRAGQ